ncbi:hypothetical protein B0H19DRAFT_1077116 [Mycena capillaripes]|nr:hypothetical protein B0H19DRAFT_1077116 [Mycena capillaripes]
MFGRRPLSALGLVNAFQRRRMVPIHTEGGLPGSESAGIIVFIRDRLVDLDNNPHIATDQADLGAQTHKVDHEEVSEVDTAIGDVPAVVQGRRRAGTFSKSKSLEPGYILDEIPLLDVNLGMSEIFDKGNIGL